MSLSTAAWTGLAAVAATVGVGFGIVTTGDDEPTIAAPATSSASTSTVAPAAPVAPRRIATATYPVFDCPDADGAGLLRAGDRVVATGVDASGEWVELRRPGSFADRVWIEAAAVIPDATFDDLPISGCVEPTVIQVTTSTVVPDTSTTVPTTSTTPTTTPITTPASTSTSTSTSTTTTTSSTSSTTTTTTTTSSTTTTTEPADTSGPSVSASASPATIWESSPGLCSSRARTTTISINVSDPSGVAGVQASADFGSLTGVTGGGTSYSATFSVADGAVSGSPRTAQITVTATDTQGNSSSTSTSVTVHDADECFG